MSTDPLTDHTCTRARMCRVCGKPGLSDPLADVLRKTARQYDGDATDDLEDGPDLAACLARAARNYFINQIKDEIVDIERYGDGGLPPARYGLKRAIKIIDFDRGLK
jgi:hypothetical protein